ncbi:hypothetical protein [Stieleria tagensis]|uniref:hypothetical protein n=1 Tax=Stieleria tagensis TaxID=2956795 RepID=UPI00209AF05B|nr:hypothetical protein [Stieleria tagensis]
MARFYRAAIDGRCRLPQPLASLTSIQHRLDALNAVVNERRQTVFDGSVRRLPASERCKLAFSASDTAEVCASGKRLKHLRCLLVSVFIWQKDANVSEHPNCVVEMACNRDATIRSRSEGKRCFGSLDNAARGLQIRFRRFPGQRWFNFTDEPSDAIR